MQVFVSTNRAGKYPDAFKKTKKHHKSGILDAPVVDIAWLKVGALPVDKTW